MPVREGQIDVSARIIADISSGIYRTPANALKELISNSFDSKARTIIVTTGYPDFNVMTCTDDGEGMTASRFEEIMGRIGGSDKRARGSTASLLGRPIIGKIGIGMLAVAQICKKFTVISSTKGLKKRFEATIDLKPFHEQEAYKYNLKDKQVRIGKYDIEYDVDEEKDASYTRIVLEEIDEGFKNRLLDLPSKTIGFELDKTDPKTFKEFAEWLEDRKIKDIPEYLRLLWELALISPTTYLEDGPIPSSENMERIKSCLRNYDFHVIVDGIKLVKPIKFPSDRSHIDPYFDFRNYEISFDGIVAKSRLKFTGYFYHQNRAIYPPELRGIMIRIRNVGIGGYDKSFLNFPQSVGPIITGMTGEIYVEDGLEEALNIDRNSFRETDPHYLELQNVIFKRLSSSRETGGILTDARYRSAQIQKRKREDQKGLEDEDIQKLIEKILGKSLTIERLDIRGDKPVKIKFQESKIVIHNLSPFLPRKKKDRKLCERLIIFYELSTLSSPNKLSMDKVFYSLLRAS